ncbi:MAG TPA: hypothetical protein VGL61_11585 [Kofleriaceae bacterium]|jgi:hypothetical protein
MRVLRVIVLGLCAGCPAAPPPEAPHPRVAPARFEITQNSFGPLDSASPATLAFLRQQLAGYDVRPVNDEGLEYHVYEGSDQLFIVVTNDDLSIFNVEATSGKVAVREHPWRVGQPFQDSATITDCECWGQHPTCYVRGERIAVNFARECGDLAGHDPRAFKALDGVAPRRVIWAPKPFVPDDAKAADGSDDPPPPPPEDGDDGSGGSGDDD